eukprot:scaffold3890_cov41-Phaeocystis_antarctica.AAC.2
MPASQSPTRVGCTASPLHPACDGRTRCSEVAGLAAQMLAPHLLAEGALLATPACDGRARRMKCSITPTRVGCADRLLRPACDGRACC